MKKDELKPELGNPIIQDFYTKLLVNSIELDEEIDARAIFNDWAMVGKDLKLEKEIEEKSK